ncbi:MAG: FAD binding domain-containing protein [Alphaproteobacteria bacterium]
MYDFTYHRPASIEDAVAALKAADDGTLLAGGQTLIPTLKQRLAAPTDLIDLGAIPGLKGIRVEGAQIVVGALTTHAEIADSADIRGKIPALADLAGIIGDPQVRNRGTIGGAVANNDPAADYPAALLALGATVQTNDREIAADDFFTDLFETALNEAEIVTAIAFPLPETAAYASFRNPASGYPIAGVMVARGPAGIRVAVSGAAPCAFRAADMEKALTAEFSADALAGISVPAAGLNTDIHASAEYRAHLVGVMARRAVAACA